MTGTPAIEAKNLAKGYGQHHVEALKDVDLTITEGEFVALAGPSGCGKSTLLNLIGGIDTPDNGELIVAGNNMKTLDDKARTALRKSMLGFVFQFFNLLSTLTVSENIALPLTLDNTYSDKEIETKVSEWLDKVGLSHRTEFYPALLSGGEMQRVAIARALIHQPKVILADEPTGNLDSETGNSVLKLLQDLTRENNQTVLMATHSPEAIQFADRVIEMKDGKLFESSLNNFQPSGA